MLYRELPVGTIFYQARFEPCEELIGSYASMNEAKKAIKEYAEDLEEVNKYDFCIYEYEVTINESEHFHAKLLKVYSHEAGYRFKKIYEREE